jgi:hypothetical protein
MIECGLIPLTLGNSRFPAKGIGELEGLCFEEKKKLWSGNGRQWNK